VAGGFKGSEVGALAFGFQQLPAPCGEPLVFSVSVSVRLGLPHVAGVVEDFSLVELENSIQAGLPVGKEDLSAPSGLVFGEVQPHDHDAVQLGNLVLAQVVLGHDHISLECGLRSPHVGSDPVFRGCSDVSRGRDRASERILESRFSARPGAELVLVTS
jgi:hypothetical protein